MRNIFRDSAIGQWLRSFGGKHLAPCPEELPDFKLPTKYYAARPHEKVHTNPNFSQKINGIEEGQYSANASNDEHHKDITLVIWYSPTDPAKPHNGSLLKKLYIAILLLIYTISVYIGSYLYTASAPSISSIFHVDTTVSSLGLSLYVLAYGIGPLLFAPLSGLPVIGRNWVYIYTYIVFVALSLAMVLVDNFAGLLVLRFLLGLFRLVWPGKCGSDLWGFLWGERVAALGPLIAGFAVQAESWRGSSWELLWFDGPVLIVVLITLPETSSNTILLH